MDDQQHDDQQHDDQLDDDQRDAATWDEGDDETYADDAPAVGPLVAAGLLGLVTLLVLVVAWAVLGRDDGARDASGEASRAGSVGAGATSTLPADVARGGPTRLGRCVRAQRALEETLEAAQPALDQWAVHVGAMNKLVVGEITLQQATEFWESTRLGAQRRVRDFGDSFGALRAEGVDCPGPALLAPGARALPGCAREVQAAVRAVQSARVSVSTWEEHIHHMDMLRLGQMTPEQATEMWLASWQRGVRELDAYESASEAAEREDGCSRAGSSR